MSYIIALAGKGGTGKTTLAGLVVRSLLKAGKKPVLSIDADPNSNLNEALGVKVDRTVVSTIDEIMENKENIPAGVTKERLFEYHFQDALIEAKGFDHIVMGHTEGAGCYCRANDLLKQLMDTLLGNYQYVVMDNEGGLEHLSRRTTRKADALLIVSAADPVSLKSAYRISRMANELKLDVKQKYLVLNESRPCPAVPEEIKNRELPLLGVVPYDREIEARSLQGQPLMDVPDTAQSVRQVNAMLTKLAILNG